ncbi:hypothetical protein OHA37_15880 [Streptomyces sp. NBC_00335]|uniref:hypothetical protein n=1 Tax=unclassified Streptomyces TaxID=2593676 RepID=UPI00225132B7|nr:MULTISPECIES: hypothetical protein [unclassified Streptomyces]MCX5405362.1 hypothetical protein [Streptomyces sp. NBC_00086]
MKKRISAVLCTATALGAMLAAPTAAHAADSHPGFGTDASSWGVDLAFGTTEQPKGLKVHVRAKGASTPVATITSFFRKERCVMWCDNVAPLYEDLFATGPLRLPALGQYVVDVEYEGTEGEPILRQDRATFDYQLEPVFENLKTSNGVVSLAQPDTVLSGDLKIHDPRDGSRKPFAGGAITRRVDAVTTPFNADAQGHFQHKVAFTGVENVLVSGNDLDYGSTFANIDLATTLNGVKEQRSVRVDVSPTSARITLDSPKLTGAYGTLGKISGTLTWKAADGTYKPPPAGFYVQVGSRGVQTDAAGRFTRPVSFLTDTQWTVAESSDWLYEAPSQVTVDTTAGTLFTGFTAAADKNKTVNVKAGFARGQIPAGVTSLKVDVQTSADGKTGWTTRKSVDVATKPGDNTAASIDTTLPYPGPVHVRLQYAGTTAIHGSVTPAVKVARTATAIPEFNVNPEPAKKGRPLTVTGKLNHADPTWKPFAGQTVHYYFRPAGTTTWKVMGNSKTTADGTFTKTFTADVTGSWATRYDQTDATHFFAVSRIDDVIVSP